MRVVVFGASGFVGRALVARLAGEHDVVAVSRSPAEPSADVEWACADVVAGTGVAAALRRAEVVYYLVHSLGTPDFERRDRTAATNVARESAGADVAQIVYLGGLGGNEPGSSPHLRSRVETGEALASAGVPVTTLGAAMVVGRGSAAFETIVALVDRLPLMILPRWATTPTQPIALEDAVACLAGVGGVDAARGEMYDIGGPDVITYRDMITRVAALRGRRPMMLDVPVLTPRLSALWLHAITAVDASVARPLVEGLRTPTVVRDDRIRRFVTFTPTPFEVAVRQALQ